MERERGSRRSMVLARGGVVATSQPLAAFAGAETLRAGGNAVDAAVAAAAVLAVVEPYNTGPGGDCLMLVWSAAEGKLHGLNGSGRAPRRATIDACVARGLAAMPMHGIVPVTVPGAVDAWATVLARFGTRSLADLLAPAIAYAEDGFPVSEVVAAEWAFSAALLQSDEGRRVFAPAGHAPRVGDVVRFPDLARTLRAVAAGGADAFYRGEIAERIAAFAKRAGGFLGADDLAAHRSDWVEPIASDYRGYTCHELPPSTQGLAALVALNVLECFAVPRDPADAASALHLRDRGRQARMRRPRMDRRPGARRAFRSPSCSRKSTRRGARSSSTRIASLAGAARGAPRRGDTVYVATADRFGNVVSLLNSLYLPFGSGLVVDGTGIVLHDRGFSFSLDPAHANALAPRKRPFHTLAPAMLCKDGVPLVVFGVIGGNLQAQAHVQVVSNLVDRGDNVQEALDRPRFHVLDGARVALERAVVRARRGRARGARSRGRGRAQRDSVRRIRRRASDHDRRRDRRDTGAAPTTARTAARSASSGSVRARLPHAMARERDVAGRSRTRSIRRRRGSFRCRRPTPIPSRASYRRAAIATCRLGTFGAPGGREALSCARA